MKAMTSIKKGLKKVEFWPLILAYIIIVIFFITFIFFSTTNISSRNLRCRVITSNHK